MSRKLVVRLLLVVFSSMVLICTAAAQFRGSLREQSLIRKAR